MTSLYHIAVSQMDSKLRVNLSVLLVGFRGRRKPALPVAALPILFQFHARAHVVYSLQCSETCHHSQGETCPPCCTCAASDRPPCHRPSCRSCSHKPYRPKNQTIAGATATVTGATAGAAEGWTRERECVVCRQPFSSSRIWPPPSNSAAETKETPRRPRGAGEAETLREMREGQWLLTCGRCRATARRHGQLHTPPVCAVWCMWSLCMRVCFLLLSFLRGFSREMVRAGPYAGARTHAHTHTRTHAHTHTRTHAHTHTADVRGSGG